MRFVDLHEDGIVWMCFFTQRNWFIHLAQADQTRRPSGAFEIQIYIETPVTQQQKLDWIDSGNVGDTQPL